MKNNATGTWVIGFLKYTFNKHKVLSTIIGLILLFIIINQILGLVQKNQFETHAKQMSELVVKLNAKSDNTNPWKLISVCESVAVSFTVGTSHICGTLVYALFDIETIQQYSDLHNKYFPVFQAEYGSSVASSPSSYFGPIYEESEKYSKEVKITAKSGLDCTYYTTYKLSKATTLIAFSCARNTRGGWYTTYGPSYTSYVPLGDGFTFDLMRPTWR